MKNNDTQNPEWYEEWFDSPYYHILYKNRDDKEAKEFILNLIRYLNPKPDSFFVDVACGKGRHSFFLNSLGYAVDGFDLSKNSIDTAKINESENLHFYVNDIRTPLKVNKYNYAFNLFTSFGYFDDESDNQLTVNAIAESLVKDGLLVLDFMNCNKAINTLKKSETKSVNNIDFKITRDFKNEYITKNINFSDNDTRYHYQEKVKAISLDIFKLYFDIANLKIEATFGDYKLNPFDINNSDRLILIARKK